VRATSTTATRTSAPTSQPGQRSQRPQRAPQGQPPRPVALPVRFDKIPHKLRAIPQWVLWRYRWEPGKKGKPGKWKKPPYQTSGAPASHSDPTTWTSFEQVRAAYEREPGRWDGIGFALTHDIGGCDLDHCRAPQTGEITAWAMAYIVSLDTYTEISPSGAGLRILALGSIPPGPNRDDQRGIEMYDTTRYLTITGWHLDGTPPTLEPRAAALAAMHASIFGPPVEVQTPPPSSPHPPIPPPFPLV
jgi:putative DNA primase/helicase